jgi:hypothetical protein
VILIGIVEAGLGPSAISGLTPGGTTGTLWP